MIVGEGGTCTDKLYISIEAECMTVHDNNIIFIFLIACVVKHEEQNKYTMIQIF